MRRVLIAALTSALIATGSVAISGPAAAGVPSTRVAAAVIPACESIAAGPVSSDRYAAGWSFTTGSGGGHAYQRDALQLRSGAGGTSFATTAIVPAFPLAGVGQPSLKVSSSSVGPVLGLDIDVDGTAAGVLHQGDANRWWSTESLPGVPAGDHAADGTLEEILAGATGAGSEITVTGIEVALGAETAAQALISSVTVGCVRYSFTAISPSARIAGAVAVGRSVTADLTGWYPSPTAATYQWRIGTDTVSTASAFRIRPTDYGKRLTLVVSASGPGYSKLPFTTAAASVGAGSFVTTAPTVSGTAKVGGKLTASLAGWSPTPSSVSYRWNRSGQAIAGATGASYTPTAADRGATITVTATGSALGYSAATSTSKGVVVGFGTLSAPTPAITGTVRVGLSVRAATGTWTPSATLTYQWRRNGAAIAGATSATYTPKAADRGARLGVTVTGARAGYTTLARTSPAIVVGAGVFTAAAPKITGTVQVGSRVTVARGTWTPAPEKVTYQWRRGGSAIKGATAASYTPTAADRGKLLSVSLTGTRAGYTTRTVTSPAVTVTVAFTKAPAPTVAGVLRVGSTLSARVAAWSPSATFTYQWRRDGVALPKATRSTYVLQVADHGHRMSVTVTGRRAGYTTGSRTSGATAKIAWPVGVSTPAITKQPRSLAPATGTTFTMTVSATGGRLGYQWQYSADGTRWSTVAGQTTSTLKLRAATSRAGYYRARVANMVATKYSASALLMVISSRADPYRPGQIMVLNQWVATMGSPRLTRAYDGTPAVAAPMTVGYFGRGSADPWWDLTVEYVGSNGVVYDDDTLGFDDSIWRANEVYSGATVRFMAYVGVPSWAVKGGVWRITDTSDWSNRVVQYVKGY